MYRKVHLNEEELIFCAVTKHWNRLSRKGVESSSLEIIRNHWSQSCAMGSRLILHEQEDGQCSLPALPILWQRGVSEYLLTAVGQRGRRHNHEGQTVCLWSLVGVTAKQAQLLPCSYSKLQRSFTGGSTTANHLCSHTSHHPLSSNQALLGLLLRF